MTIMKAMVLIFIALFDVSTAEGDISGPIKHSGGKCIHPKGGKRNPPPGTAIVTYSGCGGTRLKFALRDNGDIVHLTSGLCLVPRSKKDNPRNDDRIVLGPCNTSYSKWRLTDGGSIQHQSSGKCWHPYWGSGNPSNDNPVVVYSGCDEGRLKFGFIISKVDGGWSDWSNWSECSADCDGGSRTRSRTCSNPAPAHGGVHCEGDVEESQDCNVHPCPGTVQITPVSAEQSLTYDPVRFAIDGDMATSSYTGKGKDGKSWLKVYLGRVYCVDTVTWYHSSKLHWGEDEYNKYSCTQDGCSACEGHYRCDQFDYSLSVYSESTTSTSTAGNVPSTTGCKLGDTVRLYNDIGWAFKTFELVVTAKLG